MERYWVSQMAPQKEPQLAASKEPLMENRLVPPKEPRWDQQMEQQKDLSMGPLTATLKEPLKEKHLAR